MCSLNHKRFLNCIIVIAILCILLTDFIRSVPLKTTGIPWAIKLLNKIGIPLDGNDVDLLYCNDIIDEGREYNILMIYDIKDPVAFRDYIHDMGWNENDIPLDVIEFYQMNFTDDRIREMFSLCNFLWNENGALIPYAARNYLCVFDIDSNRLYIRVSSY